MSTRTPDATETTLRSLARVRLLALLAQHDVGGVASLWQIQRAFRPASSAWQRAWSRGGDRQAGRRRTSTWSAGSIASTRSNGRRRSTGRRRAQVRAVDAVCGVGCFWF